MHCHRRELERHANELRSFRPDALIDLCAMTGEDAEQVLGLLDGVRLLVASSIDVYRAYSSVMAGIVTDPVPLDEQAALRTDPPPDRNYVTPGFDYDPARYEKLEVEATYLARGGTVCRLPMIYGEHDYKRREEFILRRVRAGRNRIPVGSASWLWSRGHAEELAAGIRLALEADHASGEVFNLCEARCEPIRTWACRILAAAESSAELVEVPDEALPGDLDITATIPQHWAADPGKAHALLGWRHSPPDPPVRRSVKWHLDHPPLAGHTDFRADDAALACA